MRSRALPLVALLLFSASCALFARVNWPEVAAECGPEAIHAIGPAVEQILTSDLGHAGLEPESKAKLEDLALKHGAGVVECVIKSVVRQLGIAAHEGTNGSGQKALAAWKGRAFLAEHGVH